MAQATFSCPFGAIHLEDRRGTPQRRTPFAMTAYPGPLFYGGRRLGCLGNYRKGAGGSADWFPFYYRCR